MSKFSHEAIKQLTDQQVRFAPPNRRLEQLARSERLLAEIDPEKQYPYQFVCFRITDYRPDTLANLVLSGKDLQHDLGLFIAELAQSLPAIPVEELDEPVYTLEEFSKRLNVATKTINRWRKRGLIGIPILYNGRRQVGFVESLVEPFLAANQIKVERGRRFSQLSQEERDEILRRARRMVQATDSTLTEISRRIARKMGRSTETVRYTIKNFDQQHPDQALFPKGTNPLDTETKIRIYDSYRRGITVDTLAKRFSRTRTSVYRVINETRAHRLLEEPLDYIYAEEFDEPGKDAEILGPMPKEEEFNAAKHNMKIPKDVPLELVSLYETPLLSKDQEQHMFRKMNYLKHKANKLREKFQSDGKVEGARVRSQDLDAIEKLQDEANEIKEILINCNMRLVVSIAKKHTAVTDNVFELISDGNVSLIRAVEKFDYSRGFKFSTYASWAIMKNFARSIPEEKTRKERYVTGHEQALESTQDNRTDEYECLASAEQASFKVNRLLEYLDPRERQIIRMRAGLDDDDGGMTLEKIGEKLGITKERVRQLNVRAMKKLRTLAEGEREDF